MSRALVVLLLAVGLAACSEKPQVSGGKKVDQKASDGSQFGSVDPAWKMGDAASWDQQIQRRTQGQNEHSRITR